MPQQRQAHTVISSEVARIGRRPTYPILSQYMAITAKAHALGLPHCGAGGLRRHRS
jgi:hypothetical protein